MVRGMEMKRPVITVGYEGLSGAFAEAAAARMFPAGVFRASGSVREVFDLLRDGAIDVAVVRVENTYVGDLSDLYDHLLHAPDVRVIAEVVLRLRYYVLGLPGATLADIRFLRSSPGVLRQVSRFLQRHHIEAAVAFDPSNAAAEVAAGGDPTVGAVAVRRATANRYGLTILATPEETPDSYSRIFEVSREAAPPLLDHIPLDLRGGSTKTSLAFSVPNSIGALARAIQPLANAGIQLSHIQSRPSGSAPWEYVFYLDLLGDPSLSPVREALTLMQLSCSALQILGVYAAAGEPLEPDEG